jgi:hypothetical protein
MATTTPDYEARMQADIARLQAAKGVNLRAWMRANKALVWVFAGYLVTIGVCAGFAVVRGDPPGGGVLAGVFIAPLVFLRIYIRWRR